jgi:hypothetical protein
MPPAPSSDYPEEVIEWVAARARMSTFQCDELLMQSKILEKELRRSRKRRTSIPKQSPTRLNMVKIYNRTMAAAMLLISLSAGVLANHNLRSTTKRNGRRYNERSIKARKANILEFIRLINKPFIEQYTGEDMLHYKEVLYKRGKANDTVGNKLTVVTTWLKHNQLVSITGLLKSSDWQPMALATHFGQLLMPVDHEYRGGARNYRPPELTTIHLTAIVPGL